MILKNAKISGEIKNIVIKQGVIEAVTAAKAAGLFDNEDDVIDLQGKTVIPGLIDVHTHGICGFDTMDGDFENIAKSYAKVGTTAVLPTTMTMPVEMLSDVCRKLREYKASLNGGVKGADIIGLHFEGPYIALSRKGAQNEAYVKKPSVEEFSTFSDVKMITVAPEVEGCMEFIKEITKDGKCIASIGHSDCDCETALRAMENGANCLTHTYNCMLPLHHRNPGPIGAAVEKNAYAQLILDGIHIAKQTVLATYKMFGPERMVIISDSLSCACLPDGEYESGGLKVILGGGCARLPDGTLAGSSVSMWDCVKKATEMGIPFEDAVIMASRTPAELLGVKKGRIEEGYDADLLVIDDNMNIERVIIGGQKM